MSVGVVIARFQVGQLTAGHKALLDTAGRHDHLVVLLGVSPVKGDSDDPLDFDTRRLMVLSYAPRAVVIPIPGHESNALAKFLDNKLVSPLTYNTGYTDLWQGIREAAVQHHTKP